jgi:hypothetical protein
MDEWSKGLLSKIDWYGDTYFNYLQMSQFMSEWDELAERVETSEEQNLVARVNDLANRCIKDRDVLRFIGD